MSNQAVRAGVAPSLWRCINCGAREKCNEAGICASCEANARDLTPLAIYQALGKLREPLPPATEIPDVRPLADECWAEHVDKCPVAHSRDPEQELEQAELEVRLEQLAPLYRLLLRQED